MKLIKLLNEIERNQRVIKNQLLKWLKSNNIEYRIKTAFTKSEYINCSFDNGTDWPEEVSFRFSDHAGNRDTVNIGKGEIESMDDVIDYLKKRYYFVIENGKYLGQSKQQHYIDGVYDWIDIPTKRGN